MQPTVKMVIFCEKQNIAMRYSHDITHLDTDENHGNVVMEMHLVTQNKNTSKIMFEDHVRNAKYMFFIPLA